MNILPFLIVVRYNTYNIYMRPFQCKILNNDLFLNIKLHTFGIKPSTLCSFRKLYDETPLYIFYEYDAVKCLWVDLVQCFQNNLILPTLTPQAAIFGILNPHAMTPFLRTIKYLSITFYSYLSYMCLSPEKKL